MDAVQEPTVRNHVDTYSTSVLDPRELHIEQIFAPNRFDVLTILRALNVSFSSSSRRCCCCCSSSRSLLLADLRFSHALQFGYMYEFSKLLWLIIQQSHWVQLWLLWLLAHIDLEVKRHRKIKIGVNVIQVFRYLSQKSRSLDSKWCIPCLYDYLQLVGHAPVGWDLLTHAFVV